MREPTHYMPSWRDTVALCGLSAIRASKDTTQVTCDACIGCLAHDVELQMAKRERQCSACGGTGRISSGSMYRFHTQPPGPCEDCTGTGLLE